MKIYHIADDPGRVLIVDTRYMMIVEGAIGIVASVLTEDDSVGITDPDNIIDWAAYIGPFDGAMTEEIARYIDRHGSKLRDSEAASFFRMLPANKYRG